MPFGLVYKLEKDVVDGTTNERSEVEEFAVDSVKSSLEEIAFAGVFTVEKLEQLVVSKTSRRVYSPRGQSFDQCNVSRCWC